MVASFVNEIAGVTIDSASVTAGIVFAEGTCGDTKGSTDDMDGLAR